MNRHPVGITVRHVIVAATFVAASTRGAMTFAQQVADPQLVVACVQSQQHAMAAVDAANRRIEMARQTNQPAATRAAMDDLQGALSSMRTQLATCVEFQPTAAPAGHDMANMPSFTAAAPTVDPHAGHVMPTPNPATPDPHAGHGSSAAPATAAHAGHVMPAAPATAVAHAAHGAPATTQPAAAASAHAGHTATSATAAADAPQAAAQAVDPICGLKVDPADAPSVTYQGHTYHFCSEQHRQSFLKQPAKYVAKEAR